MPHGRSNTYPITFIAPDPQAISEYARKVYAELGTEEKGSAKDSIHTGFSAFLAFVATKLTKYLNEGHTELLDKGKREKH
ncbi:MAG: hypothetical protein H0X30_06365 [Anaerolineae bacterium]|nr:hypothetical protein [Anaerolineae bacterium]